MSNAPLELWVDDLELPEFLRTAQEFGSARFGFVVTPNVDHMIRFYDDPGFRDIYGRAAFTLLDSQFLAHILSFFFSRRVPVCAGSDVTAALLTTRVAKENTLVLIGSSHSQAQLMQAKYGLRKLHHYNPPHGFIRDPAEVAKCVEFVEQHSPFGFCLLAVGCPQQEILAQRLAERGRARGLALCVGASVDFVTGKEKRAPKWMQRAGFEWLYRLMQSPARLAKRYLMRGPRIFLLLRTINVRLRSPPRATPSAAVD